MEAIQCILLYLSGWALATLLVNRAIGHYSCYRRRIGLSLNLKNQCGVIFLSNLLLSATMVGIEAPWSLAAGVLTAGLVGLLAAIG